MAKELVSRQDPEALVDPQLVGVPLLGRVQRQRLLWVAASSTRAFDVFGCPYIDSIEYQLLRQLSINTVSVELILWLIFLESTLARPRIQQLVLVRMLFDEEINQVDFLLLVGGRQGHIVAVLLPTGATLE